MPDERVLSVLARLEAEDRGRARGRAAGSAALAPGGAEHRSLPVRARGVAGGCRGARDRWLARLLGDLARGGGAHAGRAGRLARGEPERCAAWRRNVAEAGLEEWAELVEGDAHATLRGAQDVFDLVFLDAEKADYESLFALARPLLEPGGIVVADNVLSHADTLAAYSAARQADSTLSSVTVPLDRGLELTVVLAEAG